MSVLDNFHPAVAGWFAAHFPAPTPAQTDAWPAIQSGRNVLIAAPTGSGKTLAAFLAVIDDLVRQGIEQPLANETHIVYVSPLKALSNDIQRNLEAPLAGIAQQLVARGLPEVNIKTFVRTGDTPQYERTMMRKSPPHIVVTTPESLYVLLGSGSGREMLANTRTVIVDEIHAIADSKRGGHLALSLERLEALAGRKLKRIGLSATQKPIEEVARFLVGTPPGEAPDCVVVDSGHVRQRDLALELPPAPLDSVMSGEVWTQVYDRLAELIRQHRTTLVFVNTRRLAERLARQLSERLGEENVTAHHGSLAKELRHDAEQRLKHGQLQALVATASLELGIDIGEVDLVCQISSTRAINAFLQRVGRSGHAVGGTPKGRLFPLSRDDLVECTALLDSVRRGELDRLKIPLNDLDVMAQQIVAEVSAQEWDEEALFQCLTRAYPYRTFERAKFVEILTMLAGGFSTRRGHHNGLIHYDAVNHMLRPRKGARLTALTSGGTIPDTADYKVILEPEGSLVGTINEDFAIESMQGDIFQLGNSSYRIQRVESGVVRVEDAHGEPPSIPFWLGEAPGRTEELSVSVSRLRATLDALLAHSTEAAENYLLGEVGLDQAATTQLVSYLAAARAALGLLPTQQTLVFERFFDEAGGMQLVIHSPFGNRINRAWGLALRKRFCRQFNFELQAAATEDAIILSLTTAHSFELITVAKYLHSNTVRHILVQALCAAPMFTTRWRWVAGVSLALPRFRGGKKIPPQIARMNAEDLLASVFPDQVACAENLSGEIQVPDHPLVDQAIRDCLEEAMDIDRFEDLLRAMEAGTIHVEARDLTEPSPLSLEVLSARPYAFLDDAPLEERRTQAVMSRRWLDAESAADIGRLDTDAIRRVRAEAWPEAASDDELHHALLWLNCVTPEEAQRSFTWPDALQRLADAGRTTRLILSDSSRSIDDTAGAAPLVTRHPSPVTFLWIATERLPMFAALHPEATFDPAVEVPASFAKTWDREDAIVEILRGRLEGLGPTTAEALAATLELRVSEIEAGLVKLETEGFAMRGQFDPALQSAAADKQVEWCERGLLARIHRYTVKRLRAEIEPVASRDFLRFLFSWQHVSTDSRMQGPDAVAAILSQLEGYEAPAASWETEILPARIGEYEPSWLDDQCLAGRFIWTRLALRTSVSDRSAAPVRATPITWLARRNARLWSSLGEGHEVSNLTHKARAVFEQLQQQGASFFAELSEHSGLLPTQVEEALAELVALGLVNSDSFGGMRALLVPADRRRNSSGRHRRRLSMYGMEDAGRWALIRRHPAPVVETGRKQVMSVEARTQLLETNEHIARTLLNRWGVIFWRLLEREAQWLPPWRDLLTALRRLEARGEVRGGRFVAGISGEQFALPEAVGQLRNLRKETGDQGFVSLSAADPLNLIGVLTPGSRVPSLTSNRVLYRDGLPIATYIGGEVQFLETLEAAEQWQAHNALVRRVVPPLLSSLA